MEIALFIWVASVVGNIGALLITTSVLCSLWFLVWTAGTAIDNDIYKHQKPYPIRKVTGKFLVIYAALGLLFAAIIPSEKTMYMIAAGYGGQKVLESEAAGKVVKIINQKLDSYIDEVETKVKEK